LDGKGRVIDNVFVERYWCTIKYEKRYLQPIENGGSKPAYP
jgi:putative transposase